MIIAKYIVKEFIVRLFFVSFFISILAFSIDYLENIKDVNYIGQKYLLYTTLLHVPSMILQVFEFIILITSILTINKLNYNREIVVLRSTGLSIFKIIRPLIILLLVIGALFIYVLQPMASIGHNKADTLLNNIKERNGDVMKKFEHNGLWLKQKSGAEYLLFNAKTINRKLFIEQNIIELHDMIILGFDEDTNKDIYTMHTNYAKYEKNSHEWVLNNVIIIKSDQASYQRLPTYRIPTSISSYYLNNLIYSYLLEEKDLSIYQLKNVIRNLNMNNIPYSRFAASYYSYFIMPAIMLSMLFITAFFIILPIRKGRGAIRVFYAILFGFIIFLIKNACINAASNSENSFVICTMPALLILFISTLMLVEKKQ